MVDQQKTGPGRLEASSNSVVILLAGLIASSFLTGCNPLGSRHTNVLLISLDTTRRDHLSCYGYERLTTPHIDALAETGLLFTRAVAVSNWTLPTHASMLTGLYPRTHGAHWVTQDQPSAVPRHWMAALEPSCLTLPEILTDAGFRTGAIVANSYYLQPKLGVTQGFQHYDYRQPGPPLHYRRAEEISDEAILWLTENPQVPFFLFLNYMDPHGPYLPPAPYDRRFAEDASLRDRFSNWRLFNERRTKANSGEEPLSAEEAAFFRDQYDGEIAYMDEHVGRLLAWLREEGRYDNTLVIVTSDHGEAFGERGFVGHSRTLYENELAIPFIVQLPFSEAAERIDSRVSHVDIFPTVLTVLGIAVPETTQGVSIFNRRPRDQFAQVHPRQDGRWGRFVVYRGSMKYITVGDGRGELDEARKAELYDIGKDPSEAEDLSTAVDPTSEALQKSLHRWISRTRPLRQTDPPVVEFSESEKKALRALGYLD